MIPQLAFGPGAQVNYREAVLRIHEGKPNMKGMP